MTDIFGKKNNTRKRRKRRLRALTRKQKQEVSSMITNKVEQKAELKTHDVFYNEEELVISPSIADMSTITQGDNFNERIGVKVDLQSLYIKLRFTKFDSTQFIRVVVFQWFMERDTAVPTWYDIMQYPASTNPTLKYEFISPISVSKGFNKQFRILKDVTLDLDSDNPIQTLSMYINKGFRKRIDYNSSTSVSGTGHIWLMMISDSIGSIGSRPTVSGVVRSRFTDV